MDSGDFLWPEGLAGALRGGGETFSGRRPAPDCGLRETGAGTQS